MVNKFEELRVWQLARELNKDLFNVIINSPFLKDWPLKDQINRAAASIMDNIAEGFGRGGTKEFIFFLSCSKGSCCEIKSQLYRSLDRNYIERSLFDTIFDKADHLEKMITKLIGHLKNIPGKGWKFEKRVDE